jgi:hypothetical protein
MSITQSKSNLAKLLAEEDLLVEQRKVETAFFDLKNRTLVIPTLKDSLSTDLQDLFISHEIGHCLWTPTEGWSKLKELGLKTSIVNIVEDPRIERKIKDKYPGLKQIYSRAYRELYNRDFFGLTNLDKRKLNLADKINLHCKVGFVEFIDFSEEEKEILNKVETANTWDDVIKVSFEIQEYMKEQYQKEREELEENDNDRVGLNDTEYSENGTVPMSFDSSDDEIESEEKPIEYEEEFSNGDSDEGADGLEEQQPLQDMLQSSYTEDELESIEDLLESFTDKFASNNIKYMYSESYRDSIYVNLPDIKTKDYIIDYKEIYSKLRASSPAIFSKEENKFNKFKVENTSIVSYLVKEFILKKNAQGRKKAKESKTGDINLNKIYSYKYNNDIFKRSTKVPGEKNHGMVFFVDWSASMSSCMKDTIKQMLCLVMFCKKLNIPYEVYAFTSSYPAYSYKVVEDKVVDFNSIKLLNLLSYKMSNREFIDAASLLLSYGYCSFESNNYDEYAVRSNYQYDIPAWFRLGNTPLNHAILLSQKIAEEFKEETRTNIMNVITLSDGESHLLGFKVNGMYKHSNTHYYNVYLRDEKKKTSQFIRKDENSISETNACLRLIKQSSDFRYFGFRLVSPREFKRTGMTFFGKYEINDEYNEFKKNNAVASTKTAFDQFWMVKSNSINTSDEELDMNGNETVAVATRKFMKSMSAKTNNRVFLNKFISFIS